MRGGWRGLTCSSPCCRPPARGRVVGQSVCVSLGFCPDLATLVPLIRHTIRKVYPQEVVQLTKAIGESFGGNFQDAVAAMVMVRLRRDPCCHD